MPEKRTYDIDARLEELRSKIPRKETKLQAYINEFLACDVTCSEQNWKCARKNLNAIQEECMRVYAKPIWCLPFYKEYPTHTTNAFHHPMKDALEDKCKQFRQAVIEHNLELCFDFLEKLVENQILIKESCWDYKDEVDPITIKDFDPYQQSDSMVNTRPYIRRPRFDDHIYSKLCEFDDGVRYDIKVIKSKNDPGWTDYLAGDATDKEMESISYPKYVKSTRVSLTEYLDICLKNRRVYRKSTLFDAIFDTLEDHIKSLKEDAESIDNHVLERLVPDLHMC